MAGSSATPQGDVTAIREELDATPEERTITLCNSGIIAISSELLWELLAADRQRQCQGRILPDRSGRTCCRVGPVPAALPPVPKRKWRASTTGFSLPASRRRCRRPTAAAHAERRHAGGTRDGVLFRRHADRPRCGDRAPCGLRPRRQRSATMSRSWPSRISRGPTIAQGRPHRPLCAAAGPAPRSARMPISAISSR